LQLPQDPAQQGHLGYGQAGSLEQGAKLEHFAAGCVGVQVANLQQQRFQVSEKALQQLEGGKPLR
jgi:hypothetical protein